MTGWYLVKREDPPEPDTGESSSQEGGQQKALVMSEGSDGRQEEGQPGKGTECLWRRPCI